MRMIGQILPVDGYIVKKDVNLPVDFMQSFTHLYQPLVGPNALMLYQTLLHEVILGQGSVRTHHSLMSYTTLPLDEIYSARTKLEAIGLLKTYKNLEDDKTVYVYILQSAFGPETFFKDAMLSSLLYHHVGEQQFFRLKQLFVDDEKQIDLGQNVTANFQDVFDSLKPESKAISPDAVYSENEPKNTEEEIEAFQWLTQMLQQRMIPVNRVLTKENRKIISQMHLLYGLETFEIERAVQWALTEENHLHQEEFKKACRDLFKVKNNNQPTRFIEKQTKVIEKQEENVPQTREDMLIQELEVISPRQLLEDLSSGNRASPQDMKAIEEVMTTQGLPAPVMNVLIHYVLLQTNMKLSKAYLEKIASHWSRAKLQTAREAMSFAKQEKGRFEKAKTQRKSYGRSSAKDIIPDWYEKGAHKMSKPEKPIETKMSEEQAQIAQMLKQFTEEN